MKILHLIYTHGVAGAEKYLLDILPELKKKGIDAELMCVCPYSKGEKVQVYCKRMEALGIKTTLIKGTKFNTPGIVKKIHRYCKSNRIAIIHSHLFNSDVLAVLVKKLFNKKMFLLSTKHGYRESYFIGSNFRLGKIKHGLYYYITRMLVHNIDVNIAVSNSIAGLYYNLKLTKEKFRVIHHGINLQQNIKRNEALPYRQAATQLIIVGRLEKIKGHQYLFDAMPGVIAAYPDVKLLVLGEGSEQAFLQQKANAMGMGDKVVFMGFRTDPYTYIANSDLIVLPSLYEPFGLVYIEAFALKVPVIAFDVPACNEIVTNNETGILVPLYDSLALKNNIVDLLQNPAERQRLTENGYKKYREYFNTCRMVNETAALYNSLNLKDR